MTGAPQPGTPPRTNTRLDAQSGTRIDAALHDLGSVTPAPGLEVRVLTRLAGARLQQNPTPALVPHRLPRVFAPFLGFVSAGLACAVIVGGSVTHSRHNHHAAPIIPVLPMQSTGVGAASAIHPAAPASAPVPAGPASRGHAKQGRARIAPQARKAQGVAVPAPSSSSPQ
jgi:hypothetical protein